MKRNLVWLASYPKSGNTWARMFLINYFIAQDKPVSINDINKFGFGDANAGMYRKILGETFDPGDQRRILSIRDRVLRGIVNNFSDLNFIKTHNANTKVFGVELIPARYTRAAVYFVRNPLDVVLSFARHYSIDHETAADYMGRHDFVLTGRKNTRQVTQYLGSWSDHVSSWVGREDPGLLVLRYEDMLESPEESFSRMVRHIGLPVDAGRLEKALAFSRFDVLQAQEKAAGFSEKPPQAEAFFGRGQSGVGLRELEPDLTERLLQDHGQVMERLGYSV